MTKKIEQLLQKILNQYRINKVGAILEKGSKIKEIGRLSRIDIAKFLGNKVYLELFVKVEADWRNRKHYLKQYGYHNQ